MENKRITFLKEHKEGLQKGIWGLELDVRHLERQKLTCKEGELGQVQDTINDIKGKIVAFKDRMTLIDDVIGELKAEDKEK